MHSLLEGGEHNDSIIKAFAQLALMLIAQGLAIL